MDWLVLLSLSGAVGASASLLAALFRRLGVGKEEDSVEERMTRLTSALSEAVHFTREIESEIATRSKLADKLQKDITTYNSLLEVKKEEVEAISQVLRQELRQEAKRSFWKDFCVNFLFFALGVGATLLIGWLSD